MEQIGNGREHDKHLFIDGHTRYDLGDKSDEESKHGHATIYLFRVRCETLRTTILALQLGFLVVSKSSEDF